MNQPFETPANNPFPLKPRTQVTVPNPNAKRPPAPSASVSLIEDADESAQPQPSPVPTVQAPQAGGSPQVPPQKKSISESDPNFTGVELPSGFQFYPFKELSLGTVKVKHQAKFARAAKERSTRLTVECVSSLLGDDVSAMDLTIPDFFWVLYWLRLNNFSKTAMTHRAVCSNPDHLHDVNTGVKTRESLITVDIINKSKIKETTLDTNKVSAFLKDTDLSEFTDLGFTLTAPRMRDTIEMEDKWLGTPEFDDIEFMADAASCLTSTTGQPVSLEDRINVVGELTPDALTVLTEFRELAQSYGVEESLTTRCKDCNAVIETEISITAFDFL